MDYQPKRLKQALENLRQTLEETESALIEIEETFFEEGEERVRPMERRGQEHLLSVVEVCQELGMGKSWVHHRIKSGEIPSIRLGNKIKVIRQDLQEFLENSRYRLPEDEPQSPREG
jgi:excisionase family DNA binding protein